MSNNRQFSRYNSRIRRVMNAAKKAPIMLKMWNKWTMNRDQFPYTVVDTACRSQYITLTILNREDTDEWHRRESKIRYKKPENTEI